MTSDPASWPVMTEAQAEAKLDDEIAELVARGAPMVRDGLTPREAAIDCASREPGDQGGAGLD